MRRTRVLLVGLALLCATPSKAFADATVFLGTTTTPDNRLAKGFAVGFGLLVVGFEFEYSGTSQDVKAGAPLLKTTLGSVLLQTPVEILGMQPYFLIGAGGYRERLDATGHQETNFASNVGGGVKVGLMGPIRLRLDYRIFKLSGDALDTPAHRFYAGLNLKF
jgi:opacity protein-like surface antigen